MDCAPVLPPPRPFFRYVHHGQIQHFQHALVRGKYRFRLGRLPQLPVKPLDGLCGVDRPAHLLRDT